MTESEISGPGDGFDLIEFPCDYTFKSVGRSESDYEISLTNRVLEAVPELELVRASSMSSRNGKYTSMTLVFTLQSRDQLETIYKTLATHPGTVMTL